VAKGTKGIELGTAYIHVSANTSGMGKEIQSAMDKAGSSASKVFDKHGKKAGQGFGKSFGSQLSASMPMAGFRSSLQQYEGVAAKSGAVAGKALGTAFTVAATAAVAGLGYTLFKGFERYSALDSANQRFKNINRTLAQTGKVGIDVQQVMEDVKSTVEGTPYSLSDAFTAATTAMASGVTDIKRYMTDVADAAAFAGEDIGTIGMAFTQVINQGKVDAGLLQNQLRNLPVRAWLEDVYGGTVDMSKAISEGKVGIEQLQYVIEKFANGTAQSAGDTIAGAFENMQTAVAKLGAEILTSLFGGPTQDATNGIKEAIDTITLKLKGMSAWVTSHRAEIKEFFDGAVGAVNTLVGAIKTVTEWLDKIGVGVEEVVIAFAAWKTIAGVAALKTALSAIGIQLSVGLPAAASTAATGITAALAKASFPAWMGALFFGAVPDTKLPGDDGYPDALPNPNDMGPVARAVEEERRRREDGSTVRVAPQPTRVVMTPGGPITIPIPRDVKPPGEHQARRGGIPQPTGANAPTDRPGLPPPLGAGSGSGGGAGGGGGGAGSTPNPVLPFNTELPEWARGGAVTPEIFSAESSWLDKRHDLEEKRALVTQLEAAGVVDEQAVLAAKNAVLEAERDMVEQDMRLAETKQKSYEDMYSQGKDTADGFTELASAVQLDDDLGIGRGLVGLAENLLKFVAGLAAAPLKGLLSGLSNEFTAAGFPVPGSSGTGGGSGGGGMFGSLFSGMLGGTGSGGATGNVDSMLALAQWSSGKTEYAPASDLVNGLADCSGSVSDLYEVLNTGTTTPGREFTTTNFANDQSAAALGFLAGYMPGALNVGVNPYPGSAGHMAATLPNGVNFEGGGGTGGGALYGGAAAGARDPQFEKQYYFPVGQQPQQPGGLPPWLVGRAGGGAIAASDTVPAMLTPGEHVLTKGDVKALGGQSGVYSLRNRLQGFAPGGPVLPWPQTPPLEDLHGGTGGADPGPAIDPAAAPEAGPGAAPAPFDAQGQTTPPEPGPGGPNILDVFRQQQQPVGPDGEPMLGPDGKPLPDQEMMERLAGFIPQAAKANTVPGTSNLSRIFMMGSDIVGGLIDTAADVGAQAAAMGANAFAPGSGAIAGKAAGFGIGLGAQAAKRSVSYWYQLAGIGADALVEQLFPLGAPSWMGFDSASNGINGLVDSKKKSGVYDTGGVLPAGGTAVNMSSRPESVLTQSQWDMMAQTGSAAQSYGVNIENLQVKDVDEMSRAISARQRLAAMQYTGRP
jgi:hypothetical protein